MAQDKTLLNTVEREDLPDIGEEKETLVRFSHALFEDARQYKTEDLKLHENWNRYRKWVDGDQWEIPRKAHLSKPVTNFIFADVETIQSLTIQNKPLLEVESDDIEISNKVREIIDYNLWYRLKIARTRKLAVKDMIQIGNGFLKVWFDPLALNGMGELAIDYVDPYSMFFQPAVTNIQDSQYVFHAFPTYRSELLDAYGDVALQIKSEDVRGTLRKPDDQRKGSRGGLLSPVTDTKGKQTDQFEAQSGISQIIGREKDMVLLKELWYKDSRTVPIEFDDDIAGDENLSMMTGVTPGISFYDDHKGHMAEHKEFLQSADFAEIDDEQTAKEAREAVEEHIALHEQYPQQTHRLKYPGGRVITIAGQTVLDDKASPFVHGDFPFIHYKNYERGDQLWAEGEVKQMISPQRVHNRMEALAIDHAIMTANSPWVISEEANVDEESLVNEQDAIITVSGDVNRALKREAPGQLSTDIPFMLENSKRALEIVSGIAEATQGRRPTGITSGKALESLKSAGLNRIAPKTEQVIDGDYDMYMQMISIMGQYYSEDRIYQLTENDGTQKQETLSPKDLAREFSIRVRARDELGATPEARLQLVTILTELGFPPVALLKYVNLPGFDKLAEDFEQQQQQALQEQLLANGNGNGSTQSGRNATNSLRGASKLGTNRAG